MLTYNGWTEEEAREKVKVMLEPTKARLIELAGLSEEEADERIEELIDEDEQLFQEARGRKVQEEVPVVEAPDEVIE